MVSEIVIDNEHPILETTSDVPDIVDLPANNPQTGHRPQPERKPDMDTTERPLTDKQKQQRERDKAAWDTYLVQGTWTAVATLLNYANGACARRAGLRHATRNGDLVQDTPGGSPSA